MEVDFQYNSYGSTMKSVHVAAITNVNAVATIPAVPGEFHAIVGVHWSHSIAPTAGLLTIAIGGVTVFEVHVTAAGPGVINFEKPLQNGVMNAAVVVTLTGGAAVKRLNVQYL